MMGCEVYICCAKEYSSVLKRSNWYPYKRKESENSIDYGITTEIPIKHIRISRLKGDWMSYCSPNSYLIHA